MQLLTQRLLLRPFAPEDFEAVHSYASCYDNVRYMLFGPNTEQDTRAFLQHAIDWWNETPQRAYEFAVVLRDTGRLIGGCGLTVQGTTGVLGWILHRDHWKQGYGAELGRALLRFGFDEHGLHRITATCDADNYGSYRVMERIGMRREGLFRQSRPGRACDPFSWADEFLYAILREEWV